MVTSGSAQSRKKSQHQRRLFQRVSIFVYLLHVEWWRLNNFELKKKLHRKLTPRCSKTHSATKLSPSVQLAFTKKISQKCLPTLQTRLPIYSSPQSNLPELLHSLPLLSCGGIRSLWCRPVSIIKWVRRPVKSSGPGHRHRASVHVQTLVCVCITYRNKNYRNMVIT